MINIKIKLTAIFLSILMLFSVLSTTLGTTAMNSSAADSKYGAVYRETADFLELCSVTVEKNQYEKSEKSIKEY